MPFDAHTNFAVGTVATAPSPATSGTTLVLTAGQGAQFPASGSFQIIVCPTGTQPTSSNAEICRATRSTDTLTITRAQESSTARSIVVGDQVFAGITAKTFTDIENAAVLTPTAVKTSGYTAAVGDFIPVNTTSGNVTITLPTAPLDKTTIAVKHVIRGGTNAVTINRGGSDVFDKASGATSITLYVVNQQVMLQYKSSTAIWYTIRDELAFSRLSANPTDLMVPVFDSAETGGMRAATPTIPTAHCFFNGAASMVQTPSNNILVGAPQRLNGFALRFDATGYTQVQLAKYTTQAGTSGTLMRPRYWDGANWQYLESSGTGLAVDCSTNDGSSPGPIVSGWVSTITAGVFGENYFEMVVYNTGTAASLTFRTVVLMFR